MEKSLYYFRLGTVYTPPQGLKFFFSAPSNARVLMNFLHPRPPHPQQEQKVKTT